MHSPSVLLLSSLFTLLGAVAAQAPAASAAAQCLVDCGNTIDVGALCGVAADDDAGITNCMCTNANVQAQLQTCSQQRCPAALTDATTLLQHSCDTLSARDASPIAQCTTTCAKASAQTIRDECPDAASGDPAALTKCLCTSQRVQGELAQCVATTCTADQDVGAFGLGALDCANVLVAPGNGTTVPAAANPPPPSGPAATDSPISAGAQASDSPLSAGPTTSSQSEAPTKSAAVATGDSPAPTTGQDGGNSASPAISPSHALGLIAFLVIFVA